MMLFRPDFSELHADSRARRVLQQINPLFFATVVVPTIAATIYFGFLASDVYVSQSQFVVRSPDKPAASGIGVLLKSVGFSNAGDEIFIAETKLRKSAQVVASTERLLIIEGHDLVTRISAE